ncbi:MAG: S1C family serine protease [Bacteroidota bacterium]|nr:S1C family serine protease [Bacteroidota bacterium]
MERKMGWACKSRDNDITDIVKKAREAVVLVSTYDAEDSLLATGSGFFVSANEILTNKHIVEFAERVTVRTSSGKEYLVTYVISVVKDRDLRKLGVDTRGDAIQALQPSQNTPQVGEKVLVIGNPLGLEGTVSEGIISAFRETPEHGNLNQLTAPISPGSSGSPVLDMEGEVIGIATLQFLIGQNLNFAVGINQTFSQASDKLISLQEWKRQIENDFAKIG